MAFSERLGILFKDLGIFPVDGSSFLFLLCVIAIFVIAFIDRENEGFIKSLFIIISGLGILLFCLWISPVLMTIVLGVSIVLAIKNK